MYVCMKITDEDRRQSTYMYMYGQSMYMYIYIFSIYYICIYIIYMYMLFKKKDIYVEIVLCLSFPGTCYL